MATAKLIGLTFFVAVLSAGLALLYLSSGPESIRLGTALAAVFGVGFSIMIAGGLMALMFHSDRSGRDDAAGRKHDR